MTMQPPTQPPEESHRLQSEPRAQSIQSEQWKQWMTALIALLVLAAPPAFALDFEDIAREGEIRFLAQHPEPQTYRYESHVSVDEASLSSGIVGIATCHHQLDPIRKVVIAFNPKRLLSLSVVSHTGIEKVEQDGHQVVLTQVNRGASICINLSSQALDAVGPNQWQLHAGPLMRRYLDGYLPMQASLKVYWPEGLLALKAAQPSSQPGVTIRSTSSGTEMDLIFAGRFKGSLLLAKE